MFKIYIIGQGQSPQKSAVRFTLWGNQPEGEGRPKLAVASFPIGAKRTYDAELSPSLGLLLS